jgi:hypothetical protein
LVLARKKHNALGASCDLKLMDEERSFTQWSLVTPSTKILHRIVNVSLLSKVIHIELLMPTMFFKGSSKAFRIYPVEIVVLTIDMYNGNFMSI